MADRLDRRGAQLLRSTGRDRYGRDVDEIRRDAETAVRFAAYLDEIASAMGTCELESPERLLVRGRDVGPSRVGAKAAKRLRSMQGGLELLAERDRQLVDVSVEEMGLESQPAPPSEHTPEEPLESDERPADAGRDGGAEATQPIDTALAVSPPAHIVERAGASEPIVRRLLAQVGDDAPAGTAARAQTAAGQLPADRLLRLLANGPWNARPREWAGLTTAERADHLLGCLEQPRNEAGGAGEIGTRSVRASKNNPASEPLSETPTDSYSVGAQTRATRNCNPNDMT
jgi:hypothetical protein